MQTIEQNTQPNLFEVILNFEGNSWSFFTCTQASRLQEALDQAEKEFSVHSLQHRLGDLRITATSAHVIGADDNHSFKKQNGKWQLTH